MFSNTLSVSLHFQIARLFATILPLLRSAQHGCTRPHCYTLPQLLQFLALEKELANMMEVVVVV